MLKDIEATKIKVLASFEQVNTDLLKKKAEMSAPNLDIDTLKAQRAAANDMQALFVAEKSDYKTGKFAVMQHMKTLTAHCKKLALQKATPASVSLGSIDADPLVKIHAAIKKIKPEPKTSPAVHIIHI